MFGLAFGLAFGSLIVIAMAIGAVYLVQRRRKLKKQMLEASHHLSGYSKYQSPPSTAGQHSSTGPQSKSDTFPVSPFMFVSNPDANTVIQGNSRPNPRNELGYGSDSDGDETVLSERWNKKPGGPGFEHVKPYDDVSGTPWRLSSKRNRALSTSYLGSPSRSVSSLPLKSKTTGQLPESKSATDLPEASYDDSFTLPIQEHSP